MPEINKNIEIVCVANDLEQFNKVVGSNPNISDYTIKVFDNTIENIGISKRYNSYIDNSINPDSNFWVIFCHQDFGFNEDPNNIIRKLDKKFIYGPIGVRNFHSVKKWIKGLISERTGYYPSLKFNVKGLFSKDIKFLTIEKHEQQPGIIKRKLLGRINQGQNSSDFEKLGKKIKSPKEVSSLDCCCIIIHSSLINKYNLRFDENLSWHMYAEDFCINALKNCRIKSKAVQFYCYHLGVGNLNEDFYNCAKYVKEKHQLKYLKTSCIDD